MVERDLFGQEKIATAPADAKPLGEYRDRGAYFTPDELALRCCSELMDVGVAPDTILEPGCGGGAFLRAANKVWSQAYLLGIDLVPECKGPGDVERANFFDSKARHSRQTWSLILGNPPFSEKVKKGEAPILLAEEFIARAWDLVVDGGYVAFLLRAALAAGVRGRIYPKCALWRVCPVVPRPSFTGGGSDKAQEYALLVFRKGHRGDFTGRRIVNDGAWR